MHAAVNFRRCAPHIPLSSNPLLHCGFGGILVWVFWLTAGIVGSYAWAKEKVSFGVDGKANALRLLIVPNTQEVASSMYKGR